MAISTLYTTLVKSKRAELKDSLATIKLIRAELTEAKIKDAEFRADIKANRAFEKTMKRELLEEKRKIAIEKAEKRLAKLKAKETPAGHKAAKASRRPSKVIITKP
jgi:hypothetical protein